jgi:hypothetical protein
LATAAALLGRHRWLSGADDEQDGRDREAISNRHNASSGWSVDEGQSSCQST